MNADDPTLTMVFSKDHYVTYQERLAEALQAFLDVIGGDVSFVVYLEDQEGSTRYDFRGTSDQPEA